MKKKWVAAAAAILMLSLTGAVYAADGITILIHGKKVYSNSSKIENGTTLVPLRIIAENLNQHVQWDPDTKTITIEEKEKQSPIERLVIQKNKDIFVSEFPESTDEDPANQALIYNLQTLYNEAYRGFLSTNEAELKTENDFGFIKNSLSTKEGAVDTSFNYVRIVQKPYIPQPGENAPANKDIIFFMDSNNAKDLYLAVQNPENLKEWKTYQLGDYGSWFQKTVDSYLWSTRGL